jgi:hypothetical protein
LRDLLVIVPSRARPGRLEVMLDAALSLSEAQTDIAVAYDDDDPRKDAYLALPARGPRCTWHQGPRDTFSGWVNKIAVPAAGSYRALASLGDDHVPRTQGWDRLLLEAIDAMGGTGIAYGNDMHQGGQLATSVVMSSDIVTALGWMSLPGCAHYHVDDAWVCLGRDAGCLAYLPDVIIEHCHPAWGSAAWDETYATEAGRGPADQAAWGEWFFGGGKDAAVSAVAALVAAGRNAC